MQFADFDEKEDPKDDENDHRESEPNQRGQAAKDLSVGQSQTAPQESQPEPRAGGQGKQNAASIAAMSSAEQVAVGE